MKPDINIAKYFIEEKQGLIVPIVAIVLIVPFMFIALFLFHREFVISYPYWISFIFSLCLSIVHYWLVLSRVDLGTSKNKTNIRKLIDSAIQSILFLCLLTLAQYLFLKDNDFVDFIISLVIVDITFLVVSGMFSCFEWNKQKKREVEEEKEPNRSSQ